MNEDLIKIIAEMIGRIARNETRAETVVAKLALIARAMAKANLADLTKKDFGNPTLMDTIKNARELEESLSLLKKQAEGLQVLASKE
ncbi:MAG TPA: hypothetical protein VJJ82_01340 [Candidatus Nanoarchaeia archaeon]|nr:hypothetical protein [Candidatus Nanoarchaeia archaeon]